MFREYRGSFLGVGGKKALVVSGGVVITSVDDASDMKWKAVTDNASRRL